MINKKKLFGFFLSTLFFLSSSFSIKNNILVMLNPAGHAKKVGRRLVESFERGETLKFANKLKKAIVAKYGARVVLTRSAGEEIVELQNASFANRLKVDFYISLHIYRENAVKPKIFLYHLLYDPFIELTNRKINPLNFFPIHESHILNIHTTISCCENIKKNLNQAKYKSQFDFHGYFGVPFKHLLGVTAPAFGVEVGICQEGKWNALIDPLVDSLGFLDSLNASN